VDAARVLDFVNTLSGRPTSTPVEGLDSYAALVEWARKSQAVSGETADRLAAVAQRQPQPATLALARARFLRELVHMVMTSISEGHAPAADTLDALSDVVAAAYAHARLVAHGGALQWATDADDHLDRITWEVARAAARLVTSPRLARVRACEAATCGWWFVDDTKNHIRRWCDMKICGNREKLRRYRAARRSEK
jgi:predicted RNA-binding Zn ribbon-like protein